MVLERIIFMIIAVAFFTFMFGKMIRKNDIGLITIIVLQAIGIFIGFIEIMIGVDNVCITLKIISYVLSIVIPIVIIAFDQRGINVIEHISAIIAKILYYLGASKVSKNMLNKLVERYPESYKGHKYLAEIYEREGGLRKAIDEYVKIIDINKKDYDSYYKIAELLNESSQFEQSITMLNNLLKIRPDYYKASMLLGDLYVNNKQYKDALNVYLDATKYNSADFELQYNLGIAYTMLNDFINAEASYRKAADINNLKHNTQYTLAQIALICDERDKAEKYFREALYVEEVEPFAYYELAKICIQKGKKDLAIAYLNKALEIEPKIKEKFLNEPLFITLKQYVEIVEKPSNEKRKVMGEKEEKIFNYLNNTIVLVSKLNNRGEYFRLKKQKRTLDNEKQKSEEEKTREEKVNLN